MLCFRLFSENNPAAPLADAVAQLREGQAPKDLYAVEPASFQQIPNAPFAYWVSVRIRRLFVELPAFEDNGRTVKQGMATANDDRFLRAWLEVPASNTLRTQLFEREELDVFKARCLSESFDGVKWYPFAKGGQYSPYYHDLPLVGNWERDGAEIRNFIDLDTGKVRSRPQSTGYYFEAGYTYPLRASRMCGQVLPAGSLISVRGSGIYGDTSGTFLGLLNSKPFDGLIKMILGRSGHPQFDMGDINATPVPEVSSGQSSRLGDRAKHSFLIKRRLDSSSLASHAFFIPAIAPKGFHKQSSHS